MTSNPPVTKPKRIISKAEILPWVPIIGYSVRLIGQDDEIVAILNIIAQNTDMPKERAQQIANEIVALVSVGGFWD